MTDTRASGRPGRPRWLNLAMAVAVAFTVIRALSLSYAFWKPGWERETFYDFRLWRAGVERYIATGQLYDTDTPGYFEPGSHSLYKYPPTFAAILKPFAGQPMVPVGRGFLIAHLLILAAAATMLVRALGARSRLALLMVLLFVNWMPIWETLSDLRTETLVLLCLATTVFLRRQQRTWLAGIPIGVAGAFMVHPWLLLGYYGLRRQWLVVLGGLAGAVATLGLAALDLPPRLTVQFFTQILPRIGGTSLSYENLSVMANAGRLVMAVGGDPVSAQALDALALEVHRTPAMLWAHILALALLAAAIALLCWLSARALCAAAAAAVSARDIECMGLGLSVCILLLVIPTSWLHYQILLALPLLMAVAYAPGRRPVRALLCGAAVIGGSIYGYSPHFYELPEISAALRSLLPLLLVSAQILILRELGEAASLAPQTGGLPRR
jgi:hypothetical protein